MTLPPPGLVALARKIYWKLMPAALQKRVFHGSGDYWERRYARGGTSGPGSYGRFAEFKAQVLNEFVAAQKVNSVIEFGSGDGRQLALAKYPAYTGVDVSASALARCRGIYVSDATKSFILLEEYAGQKAELSLSLDVIYHLVEDAVYEKYMQRLFDAAEKYVAVYASDTDDNGDLQGPHIRHRHWSAWVAANRPQWKLVRHIPNPYPYQGDGTKGSFSDFFVFEKFV